ncbi:g kinase-anchoring protein 1-A [Trichonephila inaurata madagascariensis]|uniref:G kinase-anchoring protein 1-A n=1 Tax=Trichonephila inaurata madagascariensis TaxID=2747483 RepID=A0A8X6M6C0_9ARAC|nr:g kinase-anchoring protein 1-A [Trichonephila inaurata madagascariensis]
MAVACASRFAVLKLEDDEDNVAMNKASKGSKTQNSGQANRNKSKKKKKVASEIAELQNMAFGTINNKPKPKSSSNNSKGNHNQNSQKQWEEWKAKDSEFVSETYEQDLQEALLLSKIDYEEKKDVYDALQKEADQNKLGVNKKRKKNNQKKDKGTMSLDEFQNLGSENGVGNVHKGNLVLDDIDVPQKHLEDTNFFDKIEEDVEKIITKEKRQEQFKSYNSDQEAPRFLQFQEELRKKDDEIALLNARVNKLMEELKSVKSRNKKLYGILESGEMREKAEILLQIDQLISVKDELTEQVSEYHTSLEQERSKVHALQSELKKYQQNNKKQRTESK